MAEGNKPIPDLIQARLDFINRAKEQLVEKRKNLIILRDIEKLHYDEQRFLFLLKRNLEAIPEEHQHYFNSAKADLEIIEKDFARVNKWHEKFHYKRVQDIAKIREAEKDLAERPHFRVHRVRTYADELTLDVNRKAPETNYRLAQAFIYIEQALFAFYAPFDPPTETRVGIPQGSVIPTTFFEGPIEPRLPSRDYIFSPDVPLWLEIERYIHMYVEESIILGPQHFKSDEYIPFIPRHTASSPSAETAN